MTRKAKLATAPARPEPTPEERAQTARDGLAMYRTFISNCIAEQVIVLRNYADEIERYCERYVVEKDDVEFAIAQVINTDGAILFNLHIDKLAHLWANYVRMSKHLESLMAALPAQDVTT